MEEPLYIHIADFEPPFIRSFIAFDLIRMMMLVIRNLQGTFEHIHPSNGDLHSHDD